MLRKGQYINHTKLLKLLFWLMFQLLRTAMMSRGSLLPPPTVWATCRRPAAGAASTAPELWDRWGSSAILTEPSKINSAAHRLIRATQMGKAQSTLLTVKPFSRHCTYHHPTLPAGLALLKRSTGACPFEAILLEPRRRVGSTLKEAALLGSSSQSMLQPHKSHPHFSAKIHL